MKTIVTSALLGTAFLISGPCLAQTVSDLPKPVQKLMDLPDYRRAIFGLEVLSLDTGQIVYSLNPDTIFSPGSTSKLISQGTALAILGPDFRFHTRIYRTGPIEAGTLKGDLILVASGDPNLSGRIQSDGTLAFKDEDHAYGGPTSEPVAGDPLLVIKEIAERIAASGIKAIAGRVLVDNSLFPEGTLDAGTRVVISPICVNDNLVDVQVIPGSTVGAPAQLRIQPESGYVHFVNQTRTVADDGNSSGGGGRGAGGGFRYGNDTVSPDGSHTVTVTGNVPMGKKPLWHAYRVKEPYRFAETVLTEALQARGVKVALAPYGNRPDFAAVKSAYTQPNMVAEHVSAPMTEAAKVTLKVSMNLHASMMPYDIGAYAGKDRPGSAIMAGYATMRAMLEKAGLDLSAASSAEGAGGPGSGYSPDFMVRYLRYMSQQPYFQSFYKALPILGKDGTLVDAAVNSPGAGHVHAKTGTFGRPNYFAGGQLMDAKGLAGYIDGPHGGLYAFALYVNHVPMPERPEGQRVNPGEELGQIASAVYELLGEKPEKATAKRHVASSKQN